MNIGLDFDGVIVDTTQKKIEYFKSKGININNVDKYNIYKYLSQKMSKIEIDSLYKNMSDEIFLEAMLMETRPIKNCEKYLRKLVKNNNIYIITNRPKEMFEWINSWLEKYKINDCIYKILSSSYTTKKEVCEEYNIKVFVDDDYRHLCDNNVKMGILFETQISDIKNVPKAKNWNEIFKYVKKVEKMEV